MFTTVERAWRRTVVRVERMMVLAAMVVVHGACSDENPTGPQPGPAVAYVEVSPDELVLVAGDTATLAAKLFASDGSEISGRTVTWFSSAPQFARVEGNGKVRAVAAGGPVLITATAEGMTGPAFVAVVAANAAPVVEVLDPATVQAGVGPTSITILGTGFAEDAEARWNGAARPTTWVAAGLLEVELTAADIATVGQGQIRVFNPGAGGSLSGPISLAIVAPTVMSVELMGFAPEIDSGEVRTLGARGLDGAGRPVEDRPVQWSTGDGAIASVTPSGVLMGHKGGKTTVRAEIDGRFAEAELTVRPGEQPVAYVFVDPYDVVALVGNTNQLSTLVISTSGAEIVGRPVTWTTLDPTVAVVDPQGRLQAVGKGTTRVVATVGGREGSARVEIRQYPVGSNHAYDLRLDPTLILPAVGDTTWTVGGEPRAATLHLTGATLEVDRATDRYRLTWALRAAAPGSGFVGSTSRVETGAAVRYTRSSTDYGYVLTPDGGAAFEVPAGLGDLTMQRSLGNIPTYPFHFVIR